MPTAADTQSGFHRRNERWLVIPRPSDLSADYLRVAREVPGAAERIAAVCTGHEYSKPGKPKIDWDDPEAKDALVYALVSGANALVDAFRDADLHEEAAGALALMAGQDVEPADGSGDSPKALAAASSRSRSARSPISWHT